MVNGPVLTFNFQFSTILIVI